MAEFTEVMKQRERMCNQIGCLECEFTNKNIVDCNNYIVSNPQKAEFIIMNWAKENPIITNADKFKEVFGVDINKNDCCLKVECNYSNCGECEWDDFWYREYIEPKEV